MAGMPLTRRFSRDKTDIKHITTLLVIGGVALAGIAGIAAFALSFRPSRFQLDPGHVLLYRLRTTSTEIGSDNREARPTIDERVIALIGIGPDNQVALLAEEARGRDRISLHRIEPDGTAITLDAAGRTAPGSRAIGIFDLNLLALPPSASEQSWDVQVTYGLLPAAKQLVQAKARRSQSKSNPEFQLKPPSSLEWLESGTYRQVRDLVATYRYRSSLNAVDQGTLKCTWAVEQPGGIRRFRLVTEIELLDADGVDEDPDRLHRVAMACAAANDALSDPGIGPERRRALAADLRTADTAIGRLRQLADRLSVEVLRQPATTQAAVRPPSQRFLIQVASGPETQKEQAEQLARTLTAGGFAARIEPAAAGKLRVVVGPLVEKDPETLERLQRAFPYLKPLWIEATNQ